jgi:hypothetical protein
LYWAVDFNVSPFCTLLCQKVDDELLVIEELVMERATTMDICEALNRRFRGQRLPIKVYGDATGNRMTTSGQSDWKQIERSLDRAIWSSVEILVGRSNPRVFDRVRWLNRMLHSADGKVRLKIDPSCKELIADLEKMQFRGATMELDKERDPRRSHSSDALGYLVWEEFREKATIGHKSQRLY